MRDSARLSPEIKYSFCNILKKEGKLNYLAVHEHWAQNVPKLLGTDFKVNERASCAVVLVVAPEAVTMHCTS